MAMMEFSHYSVLLGECIEGLDIKPDGIYVDGTAGGGGHSFEIAKRLTTGRLIAIDQDEDAIAAAGKRLSPFSDRVTLVRNNFSTSREYAQTSELRRSTDFLSMRGFPHFSSIALSEASPTVPMRRSI